jgi:hypothetical protein
MIDAPVVKRAQDTVRLGRLMGLVEGTALVGATAEPSGERAS